MNPTLRTLYLALAQAAELEHMICCQYLYAAYSLKRYPEEYETSSDCSQKVTDLQLDAVQRWTSELLVIARQEMGHLALVCNLRVSLGASAHFQRPNFPHHSQAQGFFSTLSLQPFGQDILEGFIRFEQPSFSTQSANKELSSHHQKNAQGYLMPQLATFETIGDFYSFLQELIVELVNQTSEKEVFQGAEQNQIHSQGLLIQPHWRDFYLPGNIKNTETALQALQQLIEEGEGLHFEDLDNANESNSGQKFQPHEEWWQDILQQCRQPEYQEPSIPKAAKSHARNNHYERVRSILKEYQELTKADSSFQPVRSVVSNPYVPLSSNEHKVDSHPITHPFTQSVADIFEASYELMLMMLMQYYLLPKPSKTWLSGKKSPDITPEDEKQKQRLCVYQELLFQPLMTIVLRPLAEMLTLLPLTESEPNAPLYTAGAPFGILPDVQLIPYPQADRYFCERLKELSVASSHLHRELQHDKAPLQHLPKKLQCSIMQRFNSLENCLKTMERQLRAALQNI